VKSEVALQQFYILQEFPQSKENQNQNCLASPLVDPVNNKRDFIRNFEDE